MWEGRDEGRRDHLVSWELYSWSREKGGLTLGNFFASNEALNGKWLWRFPIEHISLWNLVTKVKYGVEANEWGSKAVLNCQRKFVSQGFSQFFQGTRHLMSMGLLLGGHLERRDFLCHMFSSSLSRCLGQCRPILVLFPDYLDFSFLPVPD